MLHFFPPGMLQRYFAFTFVAVLGVLQLTAARYHWAGFSLLGRQRWRWSYALGVALLGGAYLWFFGTAQTLIFQPGLAGAELFTIFGLSTLAAVATTLVFVSVLHRPTAVQLEQSGERVDFGPGQGMVRQAPGVGCGPAVILISDLPDGDFPVARLSDQLVNQSAVVVNVDLAADGPVEYPEVLARLPAACSYLQKRSEVNGRGIVLIGAGIGGDLALRAAATDLAIRGVVAIDPVLDPEATGLELLHRSTFWQALHWGGLRRRLTEALSASERLLQLENRAALLVFRANPAPVGDMAAGPAEVAVVHTDDEAVQQVLRWTAEVMAEGEHVA
ncbi:MAG: hypothetical protein ACE5F6_18550 [Anaerolineae bacterium]